MDAVADPVEWEKLHRQAAVRARLWRRKVAGIMSALGVLMAVVTAIVVGGQLGLVLGGFFLVLVALAISLGMLPVLIGQRRGVWWLTPAPIFGMKRSDRRRITRAIRNNEHLQGLDERIAVDTARRRKRWSLISVFPGLLVVVGFGLSSLGSDVRSGPFPLWLFALVAVGGMLATAWDYTRARRYLAFQGPEPS